ncbi:hypothetical protein ILYODFUR_029074 [Ilyodon furcidens]|uniref:Secreted protein n=1 Tax=Ilyodon furcidens TaxID=33524 RepID=A0ABV0TBZ2_9TELE
MLSFKLLLRSFVSLLCFLKAPRRSWQMVTHTEPGSGSTEGFFLFKKGFPFHCRYMHAQYEGLLQSQCKRLSTVATWSCDSLRGVNHVSHYSNLLGFLRYKTI